MAAIFLGSLALGFSQTTIITTNTVVLTNRTAIKALLQSGTLRMISQSGGATQDAFANMVSSAANFDVDSPVEAKGEFDPTEVPLDGKITYRLTVTALDESVKAPDPLPTPSGLELRPGARAQTYQSVPGAKLRPETTLLFHGTVATNGTFTMPEFNVTAYGKNVKVPAATLTVAPAGTVVAKPQPPHLIMDFPEGDIFVGQAVRVQLILPDTGESGSHGMSQPRITSDLVFSEQITYGMRQETIRRMGKAFNAYVQEIMITPLHEGKQELIAQAMNYSLRPNPNQTNMLQSYTTLIDSDPVAVTIKPLPKEGQLPGFTGAIGSFQIEPPKLSTNVVRAGEPLTVTVVVRGDGNLGRLTLPQLPLMRQWQSFPPTSDNTLPPSFVQQRGSNAFSYTLIPLSDQIKYTPAIPFSYFDTAKETYVDLTIPPVALTVLPAPPGSMVQNQSAGTGNSNPENEDAPNREKELVLNGLSEAPGLTVHSLVPLQQHVWFLGLQFAPALGLFAVWGWDRRRRHLESHPEVVLKRRARRGLHRHLQLARRAAASKDAAGFVAGAANALREACAPHGAANPEALVCADILQELPVPERTGRAGETVRRLFLADDAMRFGGAVKDGPELLALKPDVEQVLSQLKGRL
ncbi:MAG: hypothetical protein JWR26_1723 [Pedosphaera sp.]|nr:hypothetical protein [Pedosphaera sp.]